MVPSLPRLLQEAPGRRLPAERRVQSRDGCGARSPIDARSARGTPSLLPDLLPSCRIPGLSRTGATVTVHADTTAERQDGRSSVDAFPTLASTGGALLGRRLPHPPAGDPGRAGAGLCEPPRIPRSRPPRRAGHGLGRSPSRPVAHPDPRALPLHRRHRAPPRDPRYGGGPPGAEPARGERRPLRQGAPFTELRLLPPGLLLLAHRARSHDLGVGEPQRRHPRERLHALRPRAAISTARRRTKRPLPRTTPSAAGR